MKHLLLTLAAVGAMLASSLPIHAATRQPRAVTLQITASLPASANVIRDADIAETFGYLMATKLREQGLKGRISYVEDGTDPVSGIPTLALNLLEWRVDPIGNVDCSFTASLTTPRGKKFLGNFSGTSVLAWPFGSWSAHDAAFEHAATDAVGDLLKNMRASGLMAEGA